MSTVVDFKTARAARAGKPPQRFASVYIDGDRIRITGQSLTPDHARMLAIQLLANADLLDGKEGPLEFGYDPDDSKRLMLLRKAVDDHLGWNGIEEALAGDYEKKVREAGQQLEREAAGAVRLRSAEQKGGERG